MPHASDLSVRERARGHRVSVQFSAFESLAFCIRIVGQNARLERRIRSNSGSKENNNNKNGTFVSKNDLGSSW